MKYLKATLLLLVIPLIAVTAFPQEGEDDQPSQFAAVLRGPNETPAILSGARGTFVARVSDDGTSVHYRLHYEGLLTPVMAAHIHIGQPNVSGGVTVFFCGGGGRPDCTSPDGTFEDDFTAANVMPLPAQELEAGNFDKLLGAMRHGLTYANVHTMAHGGGEIRGQIQARRHRRDD